MIMSRILTLIWLGLGAAFFWAVWFPSGGSMIEQCRAADELEAIAQLAENDDWATVRQRAEALDAQYGSNLDIHAKTTIWRARSLCMSGKVEIADELLQELRGGLADANADLKEKVLEEHALTKHLAAWCVMNAGGGVEEWREHSGAAMDSLRVLAEKASKSSAPVLPRLLRELAVVTELHRAADPRAAGLSFPTNGTPSPFCRKRYEARRKRQPPPNDNAPAPENGNDEEAKRSKQNATSTTTTGR